MENKEIIDLELSKGVQLLGTILEKARVIVDTRVLQRVNKKYWLLKWIRE